jgi:bacteriocin biosynthesis cyclodehydratase domain-containing protein
MSDVWSTVDAAVVDTGQGAIVRRGSVFLKVPGVRAFSILSSLFGGARRQTFSTSADIVGFICSAHPDVQGGSAEKLVSNLIRQRFIIASAEADDRGKEGETGILEWELGALPKPALPQSVLLLGVNRLSRALVTILGREPLIELKWADIPSLRSGRLDADQAMATIGPDDAIAWIVKGAPKLVVATCDFGGQDLLREWNKIAVINQIPFFPVQLDNWQGVLGPLVIPGESPCLECVRARENSNFENPAAVREAESYAQLLSSHSGGHPTFPTTIANLAAFMIDSYLGGFLRPGAHAELVEVDLLVPAMVTHKVLRLPRCPVCGGYSAISPVDLGIEQEFKD